MSKYYITEHSDDHIVLTKKYHKIAKQLRSCCILPTDIENMVYEYVNDVIKVNVNMEGKEFCGICAFWNQTYNFVIKDQMINDHLISIEFSIERDTNHKIHYLILPDISNNIAKIMESYDICYYRPSHLLNLFMKHYYNKKESIKQKNCGVRGQVDIKKNILYDLSTSVSIEVINKRLFKNLIIIIKCIVDYFQKN